MVKPFLKWLTFSLICLLLPISQTQTCANVGHPSFLLQTGKIEVFNTYSSSNNAPNRFHTYSVPITYPLPTYGFQISTSIGRYFLTSLFSNVYDFSVRTGKSSTPSSAQIVLFINEDTTWTTLQINYLISSRNDIFLGSFIADGFIFQSKANNQLTINYGVSNWVANSNQVSGVTQFSGIRTFSSQPLLLSFINTTLNPQTGTLTIVISTNTGLEYLYLSYYWWINGPSLTFSSSRTNPARALAYQFIGIDSVNGSQLTIAESGFNVAGTLSCNGLNCPSACVSYSECQNFKGVISGQSCFLCGSGQTYVNNNCQNSFICNHYQYFNGIQCTCTDGFQPVDKRCIPSCGNNAYVNVNFQCICLSITEMQQKNQKDNRNNPQQKNNNTCNKVKVCGSKQVLINNVCRCINGYAMINEKCTVVFSCSNGAIWNPPTYSCACAFYQYLLNGVCSRCPDNSDSNVTSCNCVDGYIKINEECSKCPDNSQRKANTCVCYPTYYLINGVCSQCPQNSQWNGTVCVCNSGFNSVNGSCIACPIMSIWVSQLQSCVCFSGYYMVSGGCITCPANYGWNGVACVCLSNFNPINGVCYQCSAGMIWNGNSCVCPLNNAWNGSACTCVQNYYLINGNCQILPDNSYYNGAISVCKPTFYLINNVCTQCRNNSEWNGLVCVCLPGLYLINDACTTCPSGATWNGTICILNCQSKSTWNGSECVCFSGLYFIQNSCLPCDVNSIYYSELRTCTCKAGYFGNYQLCTACDSSCTTCSNSGPNGCITCNSGFVIAGKQCLACPSNCQVCSDVNTCTQCAVNYTLVQLIINNSSIISCSVPAPTTPGSQLNLTGIVVANGFVYQGLTLSTLPVYFLANNCADCADLFTVTIAPSNLNLKYSIQYVVYSQYWFVVSFRYTSVIVPAFSYTIQINSKYASYFTSADLAQSVSNSVSPVKYPNSLPSKTGPNKGVLQSNHEGKQGINPQGNNMAPSTVSPVQNATRTVIADGKAKQIPTNTLVLLFN